MRLAGEGGRGLGTGLIKQPARSQATAVWNRRNTRDENAGSEMVAGMGSAMHWGGGQQPQERRPGQHDARQRRRLHVAGGCPQWQQAGLAARTAGRHKPYGAWGATLRHCWPGAGSCCTPQVAVKNVRGYAHHGAARFTKGSRLRPKRWRLKEALRNWLQAHGRQAGRQ
jgi:hypothetical protein